MKNLYDILGVDKSTSDADVKRAYRKLALELHPDKTGGNERKAARFKEVCAAYAILGNQEKRRVYDLEKRQSPQSPSIFGPLFDDLVGRVKSEGIGIHNLDVILGDLAGVVDDMKTNLPKRVVKSTKPYAGIMDFVEQFFDKTIKAEADKEHARNAEEATGRTPAGSKSKR